MKLYLLVLLVTAVLVGIADASKKSKLVLAGTPTPKSGSNVSKTFLRAGNTDDKEHEERGMLAKIPGINKISQVFTSAKAPRCRRVSRDAFKSLGLSKLAIGKSDHIETDLVAKLFSSPNFKIWAQHATYVNKQDPEGAMLAALTNVFGEKEVATMILVGKLRRRSKGIAQKLETAQFNKWYSKGLAADDVFWQVLKANRGKIRGYGRFMGIWEDYSKYIIKRVVNY
ncbi:hypothetical protein GN244_ATG04786 [Phytophthora infestans]|uniref:Secreted RxLR effector peptide protein n=1 Tax=Phytophthora infestans TaxID=4787 RepID=A0A833S8M1_PHYIN|nr:hypothetical protein GN244_ATG04784 [Phytophthora infestans]KAF4042867.1 hypothetical protein GN244_ATG04786 [Phytophthora infestans]KAF4129502.1 hypothetical protein GN958_ATG21297 [Phytophthora infestans]KAI9994412.1 hypothetical protein PInf_011037 [Phytophthora infestans]